ncbi:hypothetical protein ZWY2020_022333 [Hordeum vulgare]|nr:hypothetical protein ZWY2020_022333 [Hordeum vulgare]
MGQESPPNIPEVKISEDLTVNIALSPRHEINRGLFTLREIGHGRDLKKLLIVIGGLWVLSVLGSYCNFLTLSYIGAAIALPCSAWPVRDVRHADRGLLRREREGRRRQGRAPALRAQEGQGVPGRAGRARQLLPPRQDRASAALSLGPAPPPQPASLIGSARELASAGDRAFTKLSPPESTNQCSSSSSSSSTLPRPCF